MLLQQLGYLSSRSWQLQNWRHSSKPVHSCHLFLHWSEQCHVGGAGSWPGGEQTLTITIAWPASKYFTIHCSITDMPTTSVQSRFWVYTVKIKWLMQCTKPIRVLMTFTTFETINDLFCFKVFKTVHIEWYSLTKSSYSFTIHIIQSINLLIYKWYFLHTIRENSDMFRSILITFTLIQHT